MKFKTRKREHHFFVDEICLDDHWFSLEDLIDTLIQVTDDDIFIGNRPMADALMKRKVLASAGRRNGYAARTGSNYGKFLSRMVAYKRAMNPGEETDLGSSKSIKEE